jgi:hypothetical protein
MRQAAGCGYAACIDCAFAAAPANTPRRSAVATPNYSYEKRQRELAKKRKQEEKRQKKLQTRPDGETAPPDAADDAAPGGEQPGTPATKP